MNFFFNSSIRKNIAAHLFGMGINLFSQICLVPFYILNWGADKYGDWIVISALSMMFSMTDVGLNNVIQNRFSIRLAEQNKKECDALLTVNVILVSALFFTILSISTISLSFFDITKSLKVVSLTRDEASIIFTCLLVKVFLIMYSGIENAIFKATHNAGKGVFMDQICVLAEAIIILIFVLLKLPMVFLAMAVCFPYIVLLVVKHQKCKSIYLYKFNIKQANFALLREVFVPAISFMSFPLGNAIILQGFTLVINLFFGSSAVVLYNTTRTLCNFIRSFVAILSTSVMPEISIAYGMKNFKLMRNLHRRTVKISVSISILLGMFILVFGPFIYKIWTHNTIECDVILMLAFVLYLITDRMWGASSIIQVSTNNHIQLGFFFVGSTILAILLAYVLAYLGQPMNKVAFSLLLCNLIPIAYCFRKSLRLTHDSFKSFLFNK